MARGFVALLLLFVVAASAAAAPIITAPSATLGVFQNTAGQLIAVVSGTIPACGSTPTDAEPTYTIDNFVITVTQPLVAVTCTDPPPADRFYYANLNFGRLFDGNYTVNWNVPALTQAYSIVGNPGIGAAFSGNWFDPSQSGHGFVLEVIDGAPAQMLAYWFVFAPGGGQSWVTGVGPIDGNHATLAAYQVAGTGAQFPPHFDPTQASAQPWGTLTFTFTDCNTGRVDWSSTVAGYGTGSLPLTRLTLPAGVECP